MIPSVVGATEGCAVGKVDGAEDGTRVPAFDAFDDVLVDLDDFDLMVVIPVESSSEDGVLVALAEIEFLA